MRVYVFCLLVGVIGCATPQIGELKAISPNEEFIVYASLDCLYDKGVEHVSSYIGMSEPRFTWYVNSSYSYGWFRQPLTLVELRAKSENSTQIRRSQTVSASAFGQGDDLIKFLKDNPCQ